PRPRWYRAARLHARRSFLSSYPQAARRPGRNAIRPGFLLYAVRREMLASVVAVPRSVLAYLLILVYIAVAGPVGLVIASVFRWKSGLYALGHAGTWLALALAGIRYRVAGKEHVPDTAVVFCS